MACLACRGYMLYIQHSVTDSGLLKRRWFIGSFCARRLTPAPPIAYLFTWNSPRTMESTARKLRHWVGEVCSAINIPKKAIHRKVVSSFRFSKDEARKARWKKDVRLTSQWRSASLGTARKAIAFWLYLTLKWGALPVRHLFFYFRDLLRLSLISWSVSSMLSLGALRPRRPHYLHCSCAR